jgi:hypothetical protein
MACLKPHVIILDKGAQSYIPYLGEHISLSSRAVLKLQSASLCDDKKLISFFNKRKARGGI